MIVSGLGGCLEKLSMPFIAGLPIAEELAGAAFIESTLK